MASNNENTDPKENSDIEYQDISKIEEELLSKPEPKSPFKLIITILFIAFYFAGFNLTIFFDTIILPEYLASPAVFGATSAQGDTIFSTLRTISVIISIFALIVGGAISDDLRTRFGNRVPMILGGAILTGMGYFLMPLIMKGADGNYILITGIIVYALVNIGLGFSLAPDYALISELFTKEERGWAGLGFAGVGLLGTVIGVIIEAFLITPYKDTTPQLINWTLVGFITGGFIILVGLLTFIGTPKKNPPFPADGTMKDIIATPKYLFQLGSGNDVNNDFLLMFLVGILWGSGTFIISNHFPVFIRDLRDAGFTTIQSTNILMFMGISGAIFAGPVGVIITKIGKTKSGIVGSLILGFFTFSIAQTVAWGDVPIYALAVMVGFGTIFITAINLSLPADLVPKGKEGQFMGMFTVAASLLAPMAGVVVTVVLQSSADPLKNYGTVFLLTTFLYLGATFILLFMHYENEMEAIYLAYTRRYLITRGYISDKTKFAALKVSSSLKLKKRR